MRLAVAIIMLLVASFAASAQTVATGNSNAAGLVNEFKDESVFWKQFEIAKRIVALKDKAVLADLQGWLNHEDRHIRGNVAFIFAALGDERGFNVITDILGDRGYRAEGQGQTVASSDRRYHVEAQVRTDRYYAAHLLGDLKDRRAVSLLIPLLNDSDVSYVVPWSLGEIGDHRADAALISVLSDPNPSMRVLAIYALEKLNATTALPRLRELRDDQEKTNFGESVRVGDAAKAAIAKLESSP